MHRIHSKSLSLAERKKIWQEIMQLFHESKLRPVDFCAKHEIKRDIFAYHLTKHHRKNREHQSFFLPAQIQSQPIGMIHLRLEGVEIDFPADFNMDQLAALVKNLGVRT